MWLLTEKMWLLTLFVVCLYTQGQFYVTTSKTDAGLFEIIQQLVHGQQVLLERIVIIHNEISDLKTFNTDMEQQNGYLKSSVDDLKTSSTHVAGQMDGLVTAIKEMEQSIQQCNEVWKTNCQSQFLLLRILSMM